MDFDHYVEAHRRGERSYRSALAKGAYPYLPVLRELLSHVTIVSEVSLGLKEIPADLIVGTYAAGRRTSFAPNYMPLLSRGSEFAGKWVRVDEYHLTEGIHDPIRVYEYMNRYYVVEGNKRVSVLKYYGAASIPGIVTRLIPARNDSEENRAYYEYLDFYRQCPENYLFFSSPGKFDELRRYLGIDRKTVLNEEQTADLRSMFIRFEQAYFSLGGKELERITTGDALLIYFRVYGYEDSKNALSSEFQENLEKIWPEIELQNRRDTVALLLDDETRKSMFGRFFSGTGSRKLKIAFIYAKSPETSSWTYGHDLGRMHVQEVFGDEIETVVYPDTDPVKDIDRVLSEAAEQGADMIFAASVLFMNGCLRQAARYPDTRILVCALNFAHRLVRTYYARNYEAKFIQGIVAGAMVSGNDIGYIADFPITASIANLNAFSLGVKTVRPDARVHVCWAGVRGENPAAYFKANDIRMIAARDLINPSDPDREFGLYTLDGDRRENLAMTVWNWGVLYQKLIESIRDGSFEDVERNTGERALNYWWGMDSDAIDVFISQNVPRETARLVEYVKNALKDRSVRPFQGVIHAQNRVILSHEEDELTPDEIAHMDWLLDNVVGILPSNDMLTDEAREIVMLQEGTEPEQNGGAI